MFQDIDLVHTEGGEKKQTLIPDHFDTLQIVTNSTNEALHLFLSSLH